MRRMLLRLLWIVLTIALLGGLSIVHGQLLPYWQDVTMQCGIAVILAVSLNIVNGFTGQFSIGHAGFMAVGAYVGGAVSYLVWTPAQSALAAAHPTWPSDQVLAAFSRSHWWLLPAGMLAGGVVAALFGLLVGIPSLRLRGDYLAIVTLGFGEIIRVLLENANKISPRAEFLGGSVGFYGVPHLSGFAIVLLTGALVMALTRNLKVSIHGLAYQSVREDEIAADAMGVDTTHVKVAAFALGAFFAGIGGALFAHSYFFVPNTFNFILSINYVVMIVLGGTGSITGAAIAAVLLTLAPELLKSFKDQIAGFKDEYRWVLYALALILMMVLRPQGVFGRSELSLDWARSLLRRLRRVGPDVPRTGSAHAQARLPSHSHTPAPAAGPAESPEVLRVCDCAKVFGGLTAVSDLNLSLRRGELVGLIGPNGAGKTTVFNLLTGVYEPTDGTIQFEGRLQAGERPYAAMARAALLAWDAAVVFGGSWLIGSIVSSSIRANTTWWFAAAGLIWSVVTAPRRRRNRPGYRPCHFAARGIARTFQNVRLFPDLTVLDNVAIGHYLRRRTSLFDALFRTARMEREDEEFRRRACALLVRLGLGDLAEVAARNLPYGAQRRLEIARALATEPRLLLLDEPAAGMNPQEKAALMHDIQRIRREFGLTILLIEHDMKVVMGICERIYVLDYGQIIAEGTPDQIRNDPRVIAAYLGQEAV